MLAAVFCTPARAAAKEGAEAPVKGIPSRKMDVFLYFIDRQSRFLSAEKRTVPYAADTAEFGRNIVQALLNGPASKDLAAPIPAGTSLRALYVTPPKTVWVDFSKEIRENHPAGIKCELLTLYAVVNSLTLNIPAIDTVKLLIEGREPETLAGHVDLSLFFKANMLITR